MRVFLLAALAVCTLALPASALSTRIQDFEKSTNDGVFSLTQAQADAIGVSDARYVGFYRPRFKKNTFAALDPNTNYYFDADTILASAANKGSRNKILGVVNGNNANLGYSGDFMSLLGDTTLDKLVNGYNHYGVGLLFGDISSSITMKGTSSFATGGSQFKGALNWTPTAAVPLPAALPMLLAALGIVGGVSYRHRSTRQG